MLGAEVNAVTSACDNVTGAILIILRGKNVRLVHSSQSIEENKQNRASRGS